MSRQSNLRNLVIGSVLAWGLSGCSEPDQIVDGAPPGIDPRSRIVVVEEPSEALGEAGGTSPVTPKSAVRADIEPALATAKGESKTTASGVKYETTKEGTGAVAKAGQRVTVHYVGSLEDGRVFDSSRTKNQPATFSIGTGDVIKGWDEAVPGMKIGEVRKLVVPAAAGYGAQGRPPSIPPNAVLNFEVELINVQ
jgi:FKBP-type peptidyl-prolyl cis-trans isomerase FkpA